VYRRKETSLLVWNPEQTPVILNQPEGSLLTFEMELELLIRKYPLFLFHTIQELPEIREEVCRKLSEDRTFL